MALWKDLLVRGEASSAVTIPNPVSVQVDVSDYIQTLLLEQLAN